MYLLATTQDKVRWYAFKVNADGSVEYELHDALDLRLMPVQFDTKEAAKKMAVAAGLKTWRYVKV